MSAVVKHKFTEAEYLARENASRRRSEFYQGEIQLMSEPEPSHHVIKVNLIGEIGSRLKGAKCRSRSSDQRVKVQETGYICYPDLLVVCGDPEYDTSDSYALVNPRVIIEVLSPSKTDRHDRITKYRRYQQIPSLQEYILLHQTYMVIERFTRTTDGWRYRIFMGKSEEFSLESIPIALPMVDIFAGLNILEQIVENAVD
jgi:Uma2 family endonuclease